MLLQPDNYYHVKLIESICGKFGVLATRRPRTMIFVMISLSLLFSLGILTMEIENSSSELWIPRDSMEYINNKRTHDIFYQPTRLTNLFIVAQEPNGDILDDKHILATLEFLNEVKTMDTDGKTFSDLCRRRYANGPCEDSSMFRLWDHDTTKLQTALANGNQVKEQVSDLGQYMSIASFLGNITYAADNKTITKAEALILTFSTIRDEDSYNWQTMLLKKSQQAYPLIQVEAISLRSIDDEITRLIGGDSILFSLSINAILIYLSITLGKLDKLNSRFLLAWSGIITILLSVATAFGLSSFFGVKMNSIVFLLPFILAGVGVDDMIVVVHYFDKFSHIKDIETRMKKTMEQAGHAMTLTSLTAVLAFVSGVFIPLPGIVSFCWNAVISFLWTYILSITMFPAFLILDYRRVQANRHFFFVWKTVEKPVAPAKSMIEVKKKGSAYSDMFCDVILSVPGKIIILVSSIAIIVLVCTTMLQNIQVGLEVRDVIPDDSYVNKALDIYDSKWPAPPRVWQIVIENFDYSEAEERQTLVDFLAWFESQEFALPPFGLGRGTWLQHYLGYLQLSRVSPDEFYGHIGAFLTLKPQFTNEVRCADLLCTNITAARFKIMVMDPEDSQIRHEFLTAINQKIEDSGLQSKAFVDSETLMFAAMDQRIPQLTIETLVSAIIMVLITLLLFTDIAISFIIAIMVTSIDIWLLSVLVWWNIKLNAVSYVNFVMAVGLSVDYCVHIGHAYTHSTGVGDVRVRNALRAMGGAVLKGGVTTFVGVMMLSFASSGAFRTFFKMLFCTVVFGIFHAIVILPVVLSCIGDLVVAPAKQTRRPSRIIHTRKSIFQRFQKPKP